MRIGKCTINGVDTRPDWLPPEPKRFYYIPVIFSNGKLHYKVMDRGTHVITYRQVKRARATCKAWNK